MARRSSSRGAAGRAQGALQTGRAPKNAPPPGQGLDAGLRLLSRRAHSRVELRRKLARRGFDPETIDSVVARLTELGYLDDGAFAAGLVRRRAALRGPLALSAELAARGVDRHLVDAALGTFGVDEQLASATRLAERLYVGPASNGGQPDIRSPGYREMLETVGTKLMRRGFSASIARGACRAVFERRARPPEA